MARLFSVRCRSMNDDRRLLEHVRPPEWTNPPPRPLYDLVVIGGGTAGLVCAAGAAGLGARVALVERDRLGGDCLNTGCVPSKAMLRSARAAAEARQGASVGVPATAGVDFEAVMNRIRARRADIAPHDSAVRLASLGVDVFFGHATFSGRRAVNVVSDTLRFRKAVVATGSRPAVPAIQGLAEVPFVTNETLFDLQIRPRSLAILGGGPIGCEMAQAFARLGTEVTLLESAAHLLPHDDPAAGAAVARALAADGVDVRLGARVSGASRAGAAVRIVHAEGDLTADTLLVATGRTAAVDGLGLEAAGIAHTSDGISVDDTLRTSNRRVFASGDVASRYKFTHAADALSRIVIRNALFFGRARASALVIPWCTFTAPEVAQVGLTAAEAAAQRAESVTVPLDDVDRAVIDGETDGFVRIHHRGGRIVGATVVASHAGELIGTIALAMQTGAGLADLSSVVFPYPTLANALRQAGDAYQRTRVTPTVRRLLAYYFRRSG